MQMRDAALQQQHYCCNVRESIRLKHAYITRRRDDYIYP